MATGTLERLPRLPRLAQQMRQRRRWNPIVPRLREQPSDRREYQVPADPANDDADSRNGRVTPPPLRGVSRTSRTER